MAASKIECPECGAALRLAKRPEVGKKIRCPKCEKVFPVPAEDEDDSPAPAPKKKAARPEPAIKKPASKKASAPQPEPPPMDEEHTGPETYAFALSKDEEEEEARKKPRIEYAPDTSVKDPRGQAVAKLTIPTNALIAHGALLFFGGLFVFLYGIWPFVFSKYLVTPRECITELLMLRLGGGAEDEDPPYVEELTEEEFRQRNPELVPRWEQMNKDKKRLHILLLVFGPLASIYGAVITYGGVRCQQLQSTVLGYIAAFMAIPTGLAGAVVMIILAIKKEKWAWYVRVGLGLSGPI